MLSNPSVRLRVVFVALAYWSVDRILHLVPFLNDSVVTDGWLAGVGLGSLLLAGWRCWPGIVLGGILAQSGSQTPWSEGLLNLAAETLQSLFGVWVLGRLGFPNWFARARDVFTLVGGAVLVAIASTTILDSALVWASLGKPWLIRWSADALGITLFVPALLALRFVQRPARSLEAVAMCGVLGLSGVVVFGEFFANEPVARAFWAIPVVIWAALRFGAIATPHAVLALAVFAAWGIANQTGPFVHDPPAVDLISLRAFLGVTAVLGLLIAAVTSESDAARAVAAASERRLRAVFDTEPACVKIVDRDCRLLDMNAAGLAILNAGSLSDLRGRSVLPLVKEPYRQAFAAATRRAADGGREALRFQAVGLDGEPHWFDTVAVPFRDEAEGGQLVLAITREISLEKQVERDLHEALEFNRQIIASARVGIVVLDREMCILEWNGFMEEATGVAGEHARGKLPWEVMPAIDRDSAEDSFRRALAGETLSGPDVRIDTRSGGSEMWVWATTSPLRDAEGAIVGVLEFVRDTSGRRRAEEALRVSEERLAVAVRGSDDGIWDWNPAHDALWVSSHGKELLGYADHELPTGLAELASLVHPDDRDPIVPAVREHLERRVPFEIEARLRTRSGEYCWFRARGQAGWDLAGRPIRMAGSLTDISERKQYEKQLKEALEFNRQILASAREGLVVLDLEQRYVQWNQFMAELTGLPESEVLGRRPWEVFPHLVETDIPATIERVLAGETVTRPASQHPSRSGGPPQWTAESLSPIYTVDREIIGALITLRDITAEHSATEALRASESRFALAVKGTQDGIWDWNLVSGETYHSPRWKALLGYEDHELPEQFSTFDTWLHPDDRERVFARETAHLEHGVPFDVDLRLRTRDGSYRWFRSRGEALRDESGRPVRMAGSITDIDQLKQDQRRIRELNESLERRVEERTHELEIANQDLRHFIGSLSHDLRSPLRAISGFAQLLRNRHPESLDAQSMEWVGNVVEGSVRMGRLIDDLVSYSSVGGKGVDLGPVRLAEVLVPIANDYAPQFARLGGHIHVSPALPTVQADRTLLTQILINLIENGLKYRREHVAPEIVVGCHVIDDRAVIRVSDNGIGIPPEHHQRIFRVFERLHGQDEYSGTGMGLAIVRKAAHLLGGEVGVESPEGGGATFLVNLPLAQIQLSTTVTEGA